MIPSDSELAARSFASLLDLMIEHEDRVPRSVIEESARRGSVAIAVLHPLVHEERWVRGELAPGDWWLRLHAAMILGLMPDEAAGMLLIDLLRRADAAGDEELQKWLSGYWPALMRNKSEAAIAAARALAADRSVGWNARAEAAKAVIAKAEAEGEAALGHALDWAAGLAFDEADDIEVRAHIGAAMLEHPRTQDRAGLETLADAQPYRIRMFDRGDVEWAYSGQSDARSRRSEQQADPWSFYSPEAIAERQRRWAREAAKLAAAEFDPRWQEPFVRSAPKIGRNDPCPCGSGKKYKKCCLGAPGAAS